MRNISALLSIAFLAFVSFFPFLVDGVAENLRIVGTGSKLPRRGYQQSAVYDGDDSIYVIGGWSLIVRDEVVKYSLSSGTVEVVGTFLPRTRGTAVMDGNDIFYIGGFDERDYHSGIYRISPTNNFTYELVNNLPAEVGHIQAAWDSRNQVAYLFGGRDNTNEGPLDTIFVYNVTSNEVRQIGQLPKGAERIGAAWDPQKEVAYLFGGVGGGGASVEVHEYSPVTNTFQYKASLPYAPASPQALYAEMGQEMYIINYNGVVNYNPGTNQSRNVTVNDWRTNFNAGAAVCVPKLDRIYICGGIIGNTNIYLDEIYYIDLGNGTTTEEPPATTKGPEQPPPVDCSDGVTRMVPNPFCCENFYLCRDGVAYKYECTDGQQFNPVDLQCQDASAVQCGIHYNREIMSELKHLTNS